MSTKIFNGIKFASNNFYEVEQFLLRMRDELSTIAKKGFTKVLVQEVQYAKIYIQTGIYLGYILTSEHLDAIAAKPEKVVERVYVALKRMMKANLSATSIGDYERDVDFNFSIAIYPLEDKIIGMTFCEDPNMRNYFNSQSEVSEYGYWNNVDQPDNVDNSAWEQREKDWNKALPGIGVPKESMYVREIITIYNSVPECPEISDIIHLFEDTEELRLKVAKKKLLSEKFHEAFEQYKSENGDVPPNVVSRLHRETYDYIVSEEMKETIAEEAKKINLSWD